MSAFTMTVPVLLYLIHEKFVLLVSNSYLNFEENFMCHGFYDSAMRIAFPMVSNTLKSAVSNSNRSPQCMRYTWQFPRTPVGRESIRYRPWITRAEHVNNLQEHYEGSARLVEQMASFDVNAKNSWTTHFERYTTAHAAGKLFLALYLTTLDFSFAESCQFVERLALKVFIGILSFAYKFLTKTVWNLMEVCHLSFNIFTQAPFQNSA